MSVRRASNDFENPFLTRPVGRLFLANALPMAVVLSMGGVLNLVDGIFVGRLVGARALAAISLGFPVVMVLTALATLAGGGMASLLARRLGAGQRDAAGAVFASAHGLILAMSLCLIALSALLGPALLSSLASGDTALAREAGHYLWILILGSPVQLALGLHADALRNEGRAATIAGLSVVVNLLNIGANWLAIAVFGLGLAGSALGTVAAQAVGLALLLAVRLRDPALLPLRDLARFGWLRGWRPILALGLPLSLSFIGMALVATVTILAIGSHPERAAAGIAAYGVATRLLGFAFLPQMALALTLQSIAGHNTGAGRHDRAGLALKIALAAGFLWCLAVSLTCGLAGAPLAALFTTDPQVAEVTARILRPMTALYAVTGPILVCAMYFQALGQPGRTALLTLLKPWILTPVLVPALNALYGDAGIWLAFPVADACMLLLALALLRRGQPVRRTEGDRA